MVDKILKAINLASYDYKPDDVVEIRMQYLLKMRKEILNQREEIERLKKELAFAVNEQKRLVGKLIEKDIERKSIDMYM